MCVKEERSVHYEKKEVFAFIHYTHTLLNLTLHTEFTTKELEKVPHHGFLAQRFKMARSEPLI